MQYDFSFQNPTRIHFGRSALSHLEPELKAFGPRVMLVLGTGSVRRTGLYDKVIEHVRKAGKEVVELWGVTSNPTAAKVYEGLALAKSFSPDLILAVGGGSVIDCAKAIACGALTEKDFWQTFYMDGEVTQKALPLGVVLTMVGTGSEMNGNSVITNEESKLKNATWSGALYPVFSLLDPELTYTVPKDQMVSGICDILIHILETYMSPSDQENLSDDLAEAIMKNVIRAARMAVKNPEDYTARSNLMWGATLGLNGLLSPSKNGDWMVHQIEHQIGAYTACPHGLGLAAIAASYYRRILPEAVERFKRFALQVWDIDPRGKEDLTIAQEGVSALESFFREIGATTRLGQLGLSEASPLDEMADTVTILTNGYHEWTHLEIRALLRESL